MNGMQMVDILRETENKMEHLHKTIDKVSNEPEFRESVAVLTEVLRDYQDQMEKVKEALGNIELNGNNNQQNNNQDNNNRNNNNGNNNNQNRGNQNNSN